MDNFFTFIKRHKIYTLLIVICLFITPLVLVHILYKLNCNLLWLQTEWSAGDLISYIAGFEAFIGTVSLGGLALWQNQQIHKHHIESLEPILSMKLLCNNDIIYLIIENTGATEAKDIKIDVLSISNNGKYNTPSLGELFSTSFELYPKECVQDQIAISGENIVNTIFPQIKVKVSYRRPDLNRIKEYERTVTYSNGYDKKIVADINYNNNTMESDIDKIARANVRIANYLDGHQVAKFDELNILSGRSLRNDLVESIKTGKENTVLNRIQTIQKCCKEKQQEEQDNV